jgi:DNA-binding winged helix-turn-helix (wHTH) protein
VTEPEPALEIFTFGPFTLDAFARTLDSHATAIRLDPKTFELLEFFVRHPKRTLSTEVIALTAWQGEQLAPDAVKAQVDVLRATLARYSPRATFLIGERGGYRFVARVATRVPEFADGEASAHRLHARARYFFEKRTADALHRSIYYEHRALEVAPRFGAAYAGLARAYVLSAEYLFVPPNEAFAPAAAAAETALALDGPALEPYLVLGQVACYYQRDFVLADRWYTLAAAIAPEASDVLVFNAWLRCIEGRAAVAAELLGDALRAEPDSTVVQTTLAITLIFERRFDEAIAHLRAIRARDATSDHARLYLAQALLCRATHAEVVELCTPPFPDGYEQEFLALRGAGLAGLGDRGGASSVADEIKALAERGRYVSPYALSHIPLALGERAEALRLLERSLAERDPWIVMTLHHPQVDTLRDDPRFAALMTRVGRPEP